MKTQRSQKLPQRRSSSAEGADRHVLYQLSVQSPECEVDFMDSVFRSRNKRKALTFREDFCGTALLSSQWVKSDSQRRALGVDIDADVLGWAQEHNLSALGQAIKRIQLVQQDVLQGSKELFDIVGAFNFSYFIFKTRELMRDYYLSVFRSLHPGGLFVLDVYGGYESVQTLEEPRKVKVPKQYSGTKKHSEPEEAWAGLKGMKNFTYIWDQAFFNPIDHGVINHIHFRFKDGSEINQAFSYDWRLWTLPEIRELLEEAGFPSVQFYWEEDDEDGDGTGVYVAREEAENDPGWLAYVVAQKPLKKPVKSRRKKV